MSPSFLPLEAGMRVQGIVAGGYAFLMNGRPLSLGYGYRIPGRKEVRSFHSPAFPYINLSGKIQTWKFAYNSGQMVQAGALLYGITGDKKYLSDAARTAESCYDYFFEDYTAEDGTSFRILKAGNTWFNAVMVRGLIELYKADGNRTYIDAVRKSLDTAWEKSRTEEGLFNDDCSGRKTNETKWLLVQGAMAEMYARMAAL